MQTLTQLARAVIAADRAGELTDELFKEFEFALDAAEQSPATEQSGEAVAEIATLPNGGTHYMYWHTPLQLIPVGTKFYTRPQPAPAVPDVDSLPRYTSTTLRGGISDMVPHKEGRFVQLDDVRAMLAAASQPAQQQPSVIDEIAAERRRQIEVEGWTPEHDDQHSPYALAVAAGCYAMYTLAYPAGDPPPAWPWDAAWWKPSEEYRRNLIKAGALIAAAMERIDRATSRQPQEGDE
ncbi:hypothetical protein [Chromobacterium violaceum]|uniref:hypothetical protein n=1 Tax=Chromobacterium violaceum TaxID=536 RepID=UPI001C3E018E|nr:hypothetical protein [Chromobacterium violaceum]